MLSRIYITHSRATICTLTAATARYKSGAAGVLLGREDFPLCGSAVNQLGKDELFETMPED